MNGEPINHSVENHTVDLASLQYSLEKNSLCLPASYAPENAYGHQSDNSGSNGPSTQNALRSFYEDTYRA